MNLTSAGRAENQVRFDMKIILTLMALVVAAPALAGGHGPKLRPDLEIADAFPALDRADVPEPKLRPVGFPAGISGEVITSNWPKLRPQDIILAMGSRKRRNEDVMAGSLCGVSGIEGVAIAPIRGNGGCGIANPVRVTAVSGVPFSNPATINCTTAKAVKKWLDKKANPAFKKQGGIKRLDIAASYSCRTRNNQAGAKLSEHAKGNAIDISGARLGNGDQVTVLRHWKGKYSRQMKKLHKGACGIFGTVLGPNSDPFHQDHFHFDVAHYSGGAYCR